MRHWCISYFEIYWSINYRDTSIRYNKFKLTRSLGFEPIRHKQKVAFELYKKRDWKGTSHHSHYLHDMILVLLELFIFSKWDIQFKFTSVRFTHALHFILLFYWHHFHTFYTWFILRSYNITTWIIFEINFIYI